MSQYKDLHSFQMHVLKTLLFNRNSRFKDLTIQGLSSDHLSYHINTLIKLKYIVKHSDGIYELTSKGKEFANRMDTKSSKLEDQGKRGALIRCIREKNGKKEWFGQQEAKRAFLWLRRLPHRQD